MPYGIQKRVDLARALVSAPKLLLLDEPLAGMNHDEKQEMTGFIRDVNRKLGTTIVLIEHDIGVVMGLSDHVAGARLRPQGRRRPAATRFAGTRKSSPPISARFTEGRQMSFFLETLVGGLLAGVMYSLVAIGFVLIYKASGVFNFAQGSMVLCAALTFVTLREDGIEFWLAVGITLIVMVVLAIAVERIVLRPLVNRSPITLFMATLGLSFVIEGLSQVLMGASVHELDLGIVDMPIEIGPIQVSQFDLVAAATAGVLVLVLSLLFNKTRIGISLRAIADDPQAALSVGIRLQTLWRIVWGVAGVVALVAGLLWGARQGVQFALTLVVLKALPGAHHRRLHLDRRRHRRRPDRRRRRKPRRNLYRPAPRRQRLQLVRLRGRTRLPAGPAGGPVRRARNRKGLAHVQRFRTEPAAPRRRGAVVPASGGWGSPSVALLAPRRSRPRRP